MDDSLMTTPELMAHQQVLETFKGLAPLLGQAQLAPNPREQKRSKHQHEPPQQTQQTQMHQLGALQTPQPQLATLVHQLALLVLRHDRDLNQSRKADVITLWNKDGNLIWPLE